MAAEHSDPLIVVTLQEGLADRHRLPLNHVISVLEEVRNMVTEAGRRIQREKGLEKAGDFGLELLADRGGFVFRKGSVEAVIAITSNVRDGFLAAQRVVRTVERLREERTKKAPAEEFDAGIVRRLSRLARIQRSDKTALKLAVVPASAKRRKKREYSALFDQAAIDSVKSLQAPTFSVDDITIFGKLTQLKDRDEEEDSPRGFWGEIVRENGEPWRAQFKPGDLEAVGPLFRHQVAATGRAFYYRAQNPKLLVHSIVPEHSRDYEKAFDELYGVDKEFYKADLTTLLRELHGEQ